jgi:phage tail protein X
MPVIVPSNTAEFQTVIEASTQYPQPPTQGLIYTSVGDRWDTIAWKNYGDPTQITPLILNNSAAAITDVVPPGVQLFVPLIPITVPAVTTTPWG